MGTHNTSSPHRHTIQAHHTDTQYKLTIPTHTIQAYHTDTQYNFKKIIKNAGLQLQQKIGMAPHPRSRTQNAVLGSTSRMGWLSGRMGWDGGGAGLGGVKARRGALGLACT